MRKGNKIIWARGLVVRAAHEGVGLSRGWFATAEKMGIEIRYGAAVTAILQDGRGHASGVCVRDDDGVAARVDGREVWRFEAHCLPLTILVRHHWPAMMIDLTGSEKTALNPLWSAP